MYGFVQQRVIKGDGEMRLGVQMKHENDFQLC